MLNYQRVSEIHLKSPRNSHGESHLGIALAKRRFHQEREAGSLLHSGDPWRMDMCLGNILLDIHWIWGYINNTGDILNILLYYIGLLLVYIYIYWIWEYTDDILLMLVILKILDILMIYYSYWDILLDVVYWYIDIWGNMIGYIYILGYECSQKFSWYWYIGYTGKILLEEYGDIYGVYMGFI